MTQQVVNGVVNFYNARPAIDENILSLNNKSGNEQELKLVFSYDNLPTPGAASCPDFYATNGIPANSIITGAYVTVREVFVGGTSYIIGLQEVDGTEIDNNGLFTNLVLASLNSVGESTYGNGALITAPYSAISVEGFPYAAATGSFTAGQLELTITYIPSVQAVNQ